eukprot:11137-Heterococcus_DN1.PRE.1
MTAYECVFQSVSCLQLACEYGLQARFASELLQQRAGAWFNVPTLLAAQELGFQVTDAFILEVAATGDLAVLKLLDTSQGVQLPANISDVAAANDRMDVLRWLQEVGWVFYERTANSATAAGEVAVLLWLIEQGCRIDALQLCCTATRCGHVGIRALLEERGLLPAPQQLSTVLQAVLRLAGADDQSAAVQWLLQRGAERPAAYHSSNKFCLMSQRLCLHSRMRISLLRLLL